MSHPQQPQKPPDDAMEAYLGLDEESATARAAAQGWSQVRALPPGAIVTMEYVSGRLNLTVDHGRVTRAWPG